MTKIHVTHHHQRPSPRKFLCDPNETIAGWRCATGLGLTAQKKARGTGDLRACSISRSTARLSAPAFDAGARV